MRTNEGEGRSGAIAKRIARALKARRFPHAVPLALDRLGVDIRDFRWKLASGRFAKDYEIMLLLGARTISEATRLLSQYISQDKRTLDGASMQELREKPYLDNATISKAREIMALMRKPLIGD